MTRVDLPPLLDCTPDELDLVASVLHEHKDTVTIEAALAAHWDLVIVDCAGNGHPDEAVRADVERLLAAMGPRTHVVAVPGRADDRPATSITASAASGMSWAIGDADDVPLTLPFDVPDYLAGAEAAGAAALALATGDGSGQSWSIPVTDVLSAYVGQIASNFVPYERPWRRDGARATMSGGSYPAAMFRCSDGWMSVMCRTEREWHGLVEALGHAEWLHDEKYRDARVVARNYADELDPIVSAWCRDRTRDEVFAAGREHGFPVAPVLTMPEVFEQEQLAFRDFFVQRTQDAAPSLLSPGSPYRVTEPTAPGRAMGPPERTTGARPLEGVRVLDLAWVWSGPMVAASLADLGAEVIKVESRTRPDPSRVRGRAFRNGKPMDGPELEVTPYHNQMNRSKRSIEIDITTDAGADLVRRLANECDIVVENMRPGVLAKRGLDYAALSNDHPELVMVSLSMLGQTGPLSGIRGYAVVMSGLAGLDSLIGYNAERLIGTFNPALGDPNGAVHGLAAVLAAWHRRTRTGRGAWIDVSQVEALLSILPVPILRAERASVLPPANAHSTWAVHGTFATSGTDSWVSVAARSELEEARLAEWAASNGRGGDDLEARVAASIAALTQTEAVHQLQALGVPAAPVVGYEEIVRSGEVCDLVPHRWLGEQPLFGLVWRRAGQRLQIQRSSPLLGQDTVGVLRDVLDLNAEQLDELKLLGAIPPDTCTDVSDDEVSVSV
ncbi:CaiB/BaiF CoA-transferase family protein [Nocardioides sp. Root224]|uniref:CaiB/BaiF CoA-transferase family protein n=1 Tax=Nocardioides sp. Root224 TaxID=1736495 RepID=UPI00190FE62A|nr:CoA transferase [Nocardioides sp. Root224]